MADTNMTTGTNAVKVKLTETLTRYVLLRQEDSDRWFWQATVEARSADAAIRNYLDGKTDGGDVYVAVPERSWKPVTVTAKQTTTLDLKPAT